MIIMKAYKNVKNCHHISYEMTGHFKLGPRSWVGPGGNIRVKGSNGAMILWVVGPCTCSLYRQYIPLVTACLMTSDVMQRSKVKVAVMAVQVILSPTITTDGDRY